MIVDSSSQSDDSATVIQEAEERCQTDTSSHVFASRATLQRWQPRVTALAVTFLASDASVHIITAVGGGHTKHGS